MLARINCILNISDGYSDVGISKLHIKWLSGL